MSEGTESTYKQSLKDQIFRIKAAIRTVELKQELTLGERDVILNTMEKYAVVLDAILTQESKNDLIEIPPSVAARGGKAIDEYLEKEKEKPNDE